MPVRDGLISPTEYYCISNMFYNKRLGLFLYNELGVILAPS